METLLQALPEGTKAAARFLLGALWLLVPKGRSWHCPPVKGTASSCSSLVMQSPEMELGRMHPSLLDVHGGSSTAAHWCQDPGAPQACRAADGARLGTSHAWQCRIGALLGLKRGGWQLGGSTAPLLREGAKQRGPPCTACHHAAGRFVKVPTRDWIAWKKPSVSWR